MDIEELLADPAFDVVMPAGALDRVAHQARGLRRRRAALTVLPLLAVGVAATTLLGATPGIGSRHALEGPAATATASPSPRLSSLPYQRAEHAVVLNCAYGVNKREMQRLGGFTSVSNLVTGDPVADCAALMKANDVKTPPLTAYADGHVYLTVVPSSWAMPSSYKPLPAGFQVDLARVAAQQALEDPVDGPAAASGQCLTETEAVSATRTVLSEVGLPTYTVDMLTPARGADGSTRCAFAIFPPEEGSQVLIEGDVNSTPTLTGPIQRFIGLLRRDVAGGCLSAASAKAKVSHDAQAVPLPAGGFTIINRTNGDGGCTRVDLIHQDDHATVILRSAPLP